jgi:protein-disulfide isomerase
MKKNKNTKDLKRFLLPGVIILGVILLIFLLVRNGKNDPSPKANIKLGNLPVKEVKAQSYATLKTPTLKVDDKMFGSSDAKVKIFVYEDISSIYSAKLADTLDKLYSEDSSQLAVVVRPFISPNSAISKEAALALECAGDQNKWVPMRALLFAKAKNASLSSFDFEKYAEQIELDKNTFLTCLTNPTKSAKLEELNAEAGSYNILGAPTIFIGDEMILGARPYEDYIDSNGDSIEGLKTLIDNKMK